jgi:glycosyltransferase involved in cell wall biosynthesis
MRILWMKPVLPFPPNQGTKRVTLQILEGLAGDHEITLFTRLLDEAERSSVEALRERVPRLRVEAMLAPNRRSILHRATYRLRTRLGALRGEPPVRAYTCLPPLRHRFAELAREARPDLLVAEYWYSAPYLDAVPGVPGVLFAHDLEFLARAGAGEAADATRGGLAGRHDAAAERAALAAAPRTWFLTEGDRAGAVAEAGVDPARSAVLPYGLALDGELAPRREGDPGEERDSVLLFGSFAADFNRDALAFLLDDILPALRALKPEVRVTVAGGGLAEGARRRAEAAGVRVAGEVSSVRSALLRSAVVLVPLRFGGGLRIRLLEALALERAVVGTPVGVLGMGPRDGREVLAGETAAELAGQVARLLEDPVLRRGLGRAGRVWVEERHGLAAARREQARLVIEAAEPAD